MTSDRASPQNGKTSRDTSTFGAAENQLKRMESDK